VNLPPGGPYDVTLHNTSAGGQLRASLACDAGTTISVSPLPVVVGPDSASTLTFDPEFCVFATRHAVITNQAETAADPGSSVARTYTLSISSSTGPYVSIGDASADEGSTMILPLSLSQQVSEPVTVSYSTAHGGAGSDDYVAVTDGTVTFEPNDTTQTINISTLEDELHEDDEDFEVNLIHVTTENATIADSHGSGTIKANDARCPGYESRVANHIVGTSTANTLTGTAGPDIICGLGGNDTIDGLGADDLLLGGDGRDAILGGQGNDTINLGPGDDSGDGDAFGDFGAGGQAGNDTMIGGSGHDDLFGWEGNDILKGEDGEDVLFGDQGADNLQGGPAFDELLGNAGNDTVNGGPGFDYSEYWSEAGPVVASLVTNRATGSGIGTDTLIGIEALYGSPTNDRLIGNGQGNNLYGWNGHDDLFGNARIDGLFGQKGNDDMNGGTGNDVCIQGPGSGARTSCERSSLMAERRAAGMAPTATPARLPLEGGVAPPR
jgi:Ca2+-binding RTX toxin-like protein